MVRAVGSNSNSTAATARPKWIASTCKERRMVLQRAGTASFPDRMTGRTGRNWAAPAAPMRRQLKLSRGPDTISENFYWRGQDEANFRAIRDLPKVTVEAKTRAQRQGDSWLLITTLHNTSRQPALMVRLKAVREKAGGAYPPRSVQRQLRLPHAGRTAHRTDRTLHGRCHGRK